MGKYFSIGELCQSDTADRNRINNTPNTYQRMNMEKLIDNVLDPIRSRWGRPIYVNSGFRNAKLNSLVNGSKNSQHMSGQAADITTGNITDNKKLFALFLRSDLEYDQLISENGCQWIHVSYNENGNRQQVLYL